MNSIALPIALEKASLPMMNKAALLAAGAVGVFNYLSTQLLTQNNGLAIILSALSIPAAAYFAARPRIIAAQAAREAAERSGNVADFKTIVEKMTEVHRAEIALKERQIEEKDIEIKLLRVSKHNALGALQASRFHIDNLQDLLRKAGKKFPGYNQTPIGEIVGEEDKQTLVLVDAAATRVANQAAAEASTVVTGNGDAQ